ncbi:MAG: cytochrome c3 family protein, partial [Planctomycetota bacterium]
MKKAKSRLSMVVACLLLIGMSSAQDAVRSKVAGTKHNLSSRGPGPVKVAGETRVCRFCHTPHAANPIAPLWNRSDPGTYYQTYKSSTLVSRVGQPTGSSRLCLSCHDGTIALTQTHNPRNAPRGTIHISARDRGYIGTDLSDDHPISFIYDSALASRNGQLRSPAALPEELSLDSEMKLQCTTCHNPHDNRFGAFLTMSNADSGMCRSCHAVEEWAYSSHATSTASLAGARGGGWDNIKATTVRQAACGGCHRPHGAGGRERLMRREAEEDNCLACHDGSVASGNIAAELNKASIHPVNRTTGVHDPLEAPRSMRKHVECSDCHDPHRARSGPQSRAPFTKAAMQGAKGNEGSGRGASGALYEYQVCYRCHAGRGTVRSPLVDRALINTNVASEFSPLNPSYHPVQAQGKNRSVPSLLTPLKTTSLLYCTDCHGSDSSSGPKGPHGSRYRPLLVRPYVTIDRTTETPRAYALCYGCHSRESILADRSFSEHRKHIVEQKAPCSACHDPHGISASQASGVSGTHLINFDRRVALPSKTFSRGPTFVDRGSLRGSCTLNCHEREHVDR